MKSRAAITMYDADHIARYYDRCADREWERFERTPADRVNLHLHSHYLRKHIRSGDRVLEIGAGPGRFTIQLAELGAQVVVGDISPVQLELNRKYVAGAGWEASIVDRLLLDVVAMPGIESGGFDSVVCYGGPISYALDRADDAVAELLRAVRPGGLVLFSVMSLIGATRRFLSGVLDVAAEEGADVVERIWRSGDLHGTGANGHHCHMFRWSELREMLSRFPCDIVDVSAANFLTCGHDEPLASAMEDEELWKRILAWELDACRESGAIDGGTHIIVIVRRHENDKSVEI